MALAQSGYSVPQPLIDADFFRSGIGATTPDGTADTTEAVSRTGAVGIGIADPSTLTAALDISGAAVLRAVTVADLPTGGAVGTAAATVDVASTLVLNQTTAAQALTLPSPTNAQAGRFLHVTHNGTAAGVTVAGKAIAAGESLLFVWDGNSWNGNAGGAANDFWRDLTNAQPNGITDTTDSIRRLGHVGIGGAAITDAMPTVATPTATNNFLHLSGAAAGRGQVMFGSSPLSYYMERTLPTVVNDCVFICAVSGANPGVRTVRLSISVADTSFATSKHYVISPAWNLTGGANWVLKPLTNGGPYGGNDFELFFNVLNNTINFALRRTAGATAGTARIRLEVLGEPLDTLTEATTVSTNAAVFPLYDPFGTAWMILGNSGTTNTAYSDNAAQANNFMGTLDNQPVSIYTNAANGNAKTDLKLYTATPAALAISNPVDVFHVRRNGQAGVTFPQIMTVALGHWWTDGSSRTRADFRLGNGNVYTPDFTPLSLFSSGGLVLAGNGATVNTFGWAANGGIGKNSIAGALLSLTGQNGSNNLGPHLSVTTAADDYPVFYQLNWSHNNVAMLFDGYFDGTWRAAHTTRPYAIYKLNDAIQIYGSAAAPAAAGGAWAQDLIGSFRHAGATLGGGEFAFANVTKNRRLVLWDTTSTSDHQFYGFGINGATFRYQVDSTGAAHRWFAGTSATTSNEIMSLLGTGLLGINNASPVAALDVNGAQILRAVTLADFPANAALGTAAATVDIASTLTLSQTTAGIYLTIPNPSNGTAGRILTIYNGGSAQVAVNGAFIESGTGATFIFNGAWRVTGDAFTQYTTTNNPAWTSPTSNYSPNSGLNTVVGGVSTMPADTVTYSTQDGNYVGTLSLPPAAGRVGGLSFSCSSTFAVTIVTTNTDLNQPIRVGTNQQVHFVASGNLWRWSPVPVYPVITPAAQGRAPDFWRSGGGATVPDGTNDTSEFVSRPGAVGIGSNTQVGTSQLSVVSDTNTITDPIASFQAANLTQGVDLIWAGIVKSGTNANGNLSINAKGTGNIVLHAATNGETASTGFVGVGINAPVAMLDVYGAQVLRAVAITDLAAGGTVGTATSTVDNYSTLVLNQTTAGQALTLPSPTNATAGRLLNVTHNGTAANTTIAGRAIATGETVSFVWDGNSWNPPAPAAPTKAIVYATGNANTNIPNNVLTQLAWPNESADTANAFAANTFTAPRTGYYQVSATVNFLAGAWAANSVCELDINVNAATRLTNINPVGAEANTFGGCSISGLVQATAGQTITVSILQNSGAARQTAGGLGYWLTIAEV